LQICELFRISRAVRAGEWHDTSAVLDFPPPENYTCEMTMATPTRYLDRTTPPHLSTLILIAGLAALSMNIFLPSLPNMAAYFDVDYAVMQLSVALYLAAGALMQVIIGPLSDRYGRRQSSCWSMALFVWRASARWLRPRSRSS
jgi:MFS transporter, DHA1 family, multidrug resistance protein